VCSIAQYTVCDQHLITPLGGYQPDSVADSFQPYYVTLHYRYRDVEAKYNENMEQYYDASPNLSNTNDTDASVIAAQKAVTAAKAVLDELYADPYTHDADIAAAEEVLVVAEVALVSAVTAHDEGLNSDWAVIAAQDAVIEAAAALHKITADTDADASDIAAAEEVLIAAEAELVAVVAAQEMVAASTARASDGNPPGFDAMMSQAEGDVGGNGRYGDTDVAGGGMFGGGADKFAGGTGGMSSEEIYALLHAGERAAAGEGDEAEDAAANERGDNYLVSSSPPAAVTGDDVSGDRERNEEKVATDAEQIIAEIRRARNAVHELCHGTDDVTQRNAVHDGEGSAGEGGAEVANVSATEVGDVADNDESGGEEATHTEHDSFTEVPPAPSCEYDGIDLVGLQVIKEWSQEPTSDMGSDVGSTIADDLGGGVDGGVDWEHFDVGASAGGMPRPASGSSRSSSNSSHGAGAIETGNDDGGFGTSLPVESNLFQSTKKENPKGMLMLRAAAAFASSDAEADVHDRRASSNICTAM
jgi:hypothetical protein